MKWLIIFNIVVGILFSLCYFYQYIYIIIALVKKPRRYPQAPKTNRFAVLVSARDESAVIGQLCDSIRAQDYPADLVDILVVADNCSDNTAEIARAHGAIVYERNDTSKVGKGHAINFLLKEIKADTGDSGYDAFFVIDADNILDPRYISEMNNCFSAGNRIITSYRNTKNYGDNWVSAGYSLWFLRDAKYLHNPRNIIGTSCSVTGTGFLMDADIVKDMGGWNYFLLTEDVEFSSDRILKGERIAYCHDAIFYDEQPTRFMQSWHQRKRWAKGYIQVLRHYGLKLLGGSVKKHSFSCFDMFMNLTPALLLSLSWVLVNLGAAIYALIFDRAALPSLLISMGITAAGSYGLFFIIGLITMLTERKRIRATKAKKVLYVFTFPLFVATYIPITFTAIVSPTKWKPIKHTAAESVEAITAEAEPQKTKR